MQIKICTKCGEEKSIDEFCKDKTKKNGVHYYCKECKKIYDKQYCIDNKEHKKKAAAQYYLNNKEKRNQVSREYYSSNKEKFKQCGKKWRENNKEEIKKYSREYMKYRRRTDKNFNTVSRLRNRLYYAFKFYSKNGKCKRSDEYGINYQAICEYIGPCPGDRKDYHIDHIKPLCQFDFDDEQQIKEAFAPENHQWLTAEENLSKDKSL